MSLSADIRGLVAALSELIAEHVRLAKLELKEDARYVGVRVGLIAALAPLILVGWGFLCAALAMTLTRVMAADLALLIVGALNLAIGLGGIAIAGSQLGKLKAMAATQVEFEATREIIVHRQASPPSATERPEASP